MPNPGDFDPAKAVQGVRQQRAAEEAEKQRVQAQLEERRANIRELFRYADEQLEVVRNPVVSEFFVTERWETTERISDEREPEDFRRTLRVGQRTSAKLLKKAGFFRSPLWEYTVTTSHERQTRYYGSWLSLHDSEFGGERGLVKLRQPQAGYAYVGGCSSTPPNKSCYTIVALAGYHSHEYRNFQIFTSLEEAIGDSPLGSVEELTKYVIQALDFVATGQPPPRPYTEDDPYGGSGWQGD